MHEQPAPPVHGHCAPGFEPVRAAFARHLGDEVGAAFAVWRADEALVDLWGGWMDRRRQRPWAEDTLVCTFSCSKAMTALVIAQAVADGALDLDTPVAFWWPEFAAHGKGDIPLRWLLSHQAGLPGVRTALPAEALYDPETMAAALADEAPWWVPGTAHGYHARSFGWLLGTVLERATGETVGSWFRERVAQPLAVDFHIGLPDAEHRRVADMLPARVRPGAVAAGDGRGAAMLRAMRDPGTPTGAAFGNPPSQPGYMNSPIFRRVEIPALNGHGTARALARVHAVLAAQDSSRLLPPAVRDTVVTEAAFGEDRVLLTPMRYGLGVMLGHAGVPLGPGTRGFGHAGAGGSLAFAHPDTGLGCAFVMNAMRQGVVTGSATAVALVDAVFACLEQV